MSYKVIITTEAEREFEQIVSYLVNVLKSPAAASSFVEEFTRKIKSVQSNPEMHAFSRMPELAKLEYKVFFVKRYAAMYKIQNNLIVIAHIFHQTEEYSKYIK